MLTMRQRPIVILQNNRYFIQYKGDSWFVNSEIKYINNFLLFHDHGSNRTIALNLENLEELIIRKVSIEKEAGKN